MPKDNAPARKPTCPADIPDQASPPRKVKALIEQPSVATLEVDNYISGVFATFRENFAKYWNLTKSERAIQARLELAEKTLCLTREYLIDTLKRAEGSLTPADWEPLLNSVRFVGVRLIDACYAVLRDQKKVTSEELLTALNGGGYRFRTTSPLREIHAAMLKSKRSVRKLGNEYLWIGGGEPIEMRPKLVVAPETNELLEHEPTGTEGE